MEVRQNSYFLPSWSLETKHDLYQVWAPCVEADPDNGFTRKRDHWAASWSSDRINRGAFRKGASFEEVISAIPTKYHAAFKEAIEDWRMRHRFTVTEP